MKIVDDWQGHRWVCSGDVALVSPLMYATILHAPTAPPECTDLYRRRYLLLRDYYCGGREGENAPERGSRDWDAGATSLALAALAKDPGAWVMLGPHEARRLDEALAACADLSWRHIAELRS